MDKERERTKVRSLCNVASVDEELAVSIPTGHLGDAGDVVALTAAVAVEFAHRIGLINHVPS